MNQARECSHPSKVQSVGTGAWLMVPMYLHLFTAAFMKS